MRAIRLLTSTLAGELGMSVQIADHQLKADIRRNKRGSRRISHNGNGAGERMTTICQVTEYLNDLTGDADVDVVRQRRRCAIAGQRRSYNAYSFHGSYYSFLASATTSSQTASTS